ncbi:hypothetical protein GCM10009122_23250 [Fulvivirga kasyanovii]|uniref:Uncharacterized protein n=1 Tax=Fulvivirga kasyanovii TaxID=396812 RepID=A0ABW9RZW8_9BACT|nr:hypothetical protein [Fulvivirga kasyanovii]MTI28969.1 hypothetical protein [Fulvivirga kasyanovii]
MATTIKVSDKTFVIPESSSPCDMWRAYFNKLKKEMGHENAKMIWLMTWQSNGATACTTSADFNKWLKKNDIDVSSATGRAIADFTGIGSNILGFGKGLTKTLSIAIPLTLAGVVAAILFILFNTARKADLTDAAMLMPQGRLAQLLK